MSQAPAADGPDAMRREQLLARLQLAVRRYQRDIDLFDQRLADRLGLNRTDLRCVDLLFDGPLSPGGLAAQAGVTAAAATTIVDRLARAGYVRRVRDPDDRRRIRVEVTPRLLRRVAELLGPYVEDAIAETADYSDDELRVICRWLDASHDRRLRHVDRLAERPTGGTGQR
jgi:DNA-binding MarR family transcriptional regulator